MRKLSNTEAELKKALLIKKVCIRYERTVSFLFYKKRNHLIFGFFRQHVGTASNITLILRRFNNSTVSILIETFTTLAV